MGFLGDLWDSFTGEAQRRDIARGQKQSNALLDEGYGTAGGRLDTAYDTARSYVDPYVASGARYQSMYDDLMGLNGPEARARAQGIITSDPLWTGQLAASSQAAQRALNARGLGGSGTAALAGARVLNENYQPVLNRYAAGGAQGQQAAQVGAGLATNYGSERANLDYGVAQQKAGVAQQGANALAQSRGILGNNLLGLGSTLITGFTPGWGGATAFGNMGKAVTSGWNALLGK
jgi:hypothetical protein